MHAKLARIAAAFSMLLIASSATANDQRPNFILIIADDMAWDDCGAYGHPYIKTPNIDRLAREGMRFDRAFLTCSSCSPSRSSIITGRYPHSTGAEQLHWPLPAMQVTFVEKLKAAGYYTAQTGKWHLGDAVKDRFDLVRDRDYAMAETLRSRPLDKPFFLWLAFSDPHRPYEPGAIAEPHLPSDAIVPPYLPDVPQTREDLALYYDEIGRLDGVVGELLAVLDEQAAADNTLILFMSDNGRPFPRCKTTVYDSGIRTPLVVRWPSRVAAGATCQSLVSSIDVAPTFLALAGLKPSPTFQGVSLAPMLTDPSATTREHVFAEHNWHDYTAHKRAVRSGRYKYIRNAYPDLRGTPPADAVRSPTYEAMQRLHAEGKLTRDQENPFVAPRPEEELYDVEADPHELDNLAGNPQYAQVLSELRSVLSDWRRETRDRVPELRTPDEFDRETGEQVRRASGLSTRRPIPELRASAE